MIRYAHRFDTHICPLCAAVDSDGKLTHLLFAYETGQDDLLGAIGEPVEWRADPCRAVERQIGEYMRGERRVFDLPIAPRGTDFQMRVWKLLQDVPFGETRSYGEIARELGEPRASRAVGCANSANPIVIVIPCHRVVGADGSLTGFGGSIATKRALLDLEGQALLF